QQVNSDFGHPRRFNVTTRVGRDLIEFQTPLPDPFIRHTIVVSWMDLLKGLLRRGLRIEMTIGADKETIGRTMQIASTPNLCTSTYTDVFGTYTCERPDGHEGWHQAGTAKWRDQV